MKISEVLRRVGGRVPTDLSFYRPKLDELFGIFGEDRVLFGSDWPNSDNWVPYPQVFGTVHECFTARSRDRRKIFSEELRRCISVDQPKLKLSILRWRAVRVVDYQNVHRHALHLLQS